MWSVLIILCEFLKRRRWHDGIKGGGFKFHWKNKNSEVLLEPKEMVPFNACCSASENQGKFMHYTG